jgi:hypothetical protein
MEEAVEESPGGLKWPVQGRRGEGMRSFLFEVDKRIFFSPRGKRWDYKAS